MVNGGSRTVSVQGYRAGLRPEIELLLCCARLRLSAVETGRIIHLFACDLDWAYLINLASTHGLAPLLYRHVSALAPAAVPRPVFVELWAHYEGNARRNQALANALLDTLRILDAHGIPALPYKGPALAAAVYGDVALRECGDLDILVRREDVLRARRALQEHGYAPRYDLKPAVEQAFLRSRIQYHLQMDHAARGIMLEIHWKTDLDFPVERADDPAWWANLNRASPGEGSVRRFTVEELLLVLCLHGTRHAWDSLGWLVDVSELIRQHPELDWDWVLRRAGELQCEHRLGVGLALADGLLDVPLPASIQNFLAGAVIPRQLAAKIGARLLLAEPVDTGVIGNLWFNMGLLYDRPWPRMRYALNVVLAPSLVEWTRWPLPRALFFLYLPLRLSRLIAKRAWRPPESQKR
jgi:hypothetical protein